LDHSNVSKWELISVILEYLHFNYVLMISVLSFNIQCVVIPILKYELISLKPWNTYISITNFPDFSHDFGIELRYLQIFPLNNNSFKLEVFI